MGNLIVIELSIGTCQMQDQLVIIRQRIVLMNDQSGENVKCLFEEESIESRLWIDILLRSTYVLLRKNKIYISW